MPLKVIFVVLNELLTFVTVLDQLFGNDDNKKCAWTSSLEPLLININLDIIELKLLCSLSYMFDNALIKPNGIFLLTIL